MRWKWFMAIGALTVVVLIAAVYAYLNAYDYNKLKPRIARMVKDATGRKLDLAGEVDLAIGFSPALVVRDVTLANASWASQPKMLKIDELRAQVRLLPLLFRDVELKNIGFKGVDVALETNPDGVGNWEFAVDQSPIQRARTLKATEINIDNIRIENLNLTLHDGKTKSAKRINLIDLKATRQTTADELTIDLKANYKGQPLTFSGKTGLVSEAMASKRFPLELSGAFSNATIKIEGSLDNVLELKGIDIKVQTSGENLAKLKLTDNIQLPKTNAFDITGHLKGSKESLALNDVSGNLFVSDINLSFSGSVGDMVALSGIDLKLDGSGRDLSEIGPLVGAELPELGPFDVSGKLSGSAKAIALEDFLALVDKSDFNGMAKLEFLKRPKITVRLESSVIDFTALMKSLEKYSQKPAKKDKQKRRLFSDDPLSFDALRKVDADIVLKARNIHAKDAQLEFGHLTLKLENSDFSVDRLEATYKKTKISGNLHIDPGSPPQVAAHFLVQSFNLGDFLKETENSDQVRAIVDIAAHGKSRGDSVRGLMRFLY